MKVRILNIINKILFRLGLKLTTKDFGSEYIFIDTREDDKFSFESISNFSVDTTLNIAFFVNVPINATVQKPFIKAWMETLNLYKKEDKSIKQEKRPSYQYLKNFYDNYKPQNVAERLNIKLPPPIKNNNEYFNSHPLATIMPWDIADHQQYQGRMQNGMKREFEENSEWNYHIEDGHKFLGPVSERMLQVEYKRLTLTFDSIQKEGFYNYEKLRGVLLVNQDTIKVDIIGGMHRFAVLLALDYHKIPVYIEMNRNRIIKRDDYKNWHHVKSGLYNEEQALEIFDKNFSL